MLGKIILDFLITILTGLELLLGCFIHFFLTRINLEQRMYQGQVSDLTSLKEDLSRLLKIAQQIEPYLR